MTTDNPLADLGLDLADTAETVAPADAAAAEPTAEAKATRAPRVEVNVDVSVEEAFEVLPALVRGGGFGERTSKYPFDTLGAPVKQEDGSWGYAVFTVKPSEAEGDIEAVKRSVQSANTQANGKFKAEGRKFVTRSVLAANGEAVAIKVYRVDATLDAAE